MLLRWLSTLSLPSMMPEDDEELQADATVVVQIVAELVLLGLRIDLLPH